MNLSRLDLQDQTLALINMLAPEHSRTSCSDNNISNAVVVEDGRVTLPGRCARCSLLTLPISGFKPDPDGESDILYQL